MSNCLSFDLAVWLLPGMHLVPIFEGSLISSAIPPMYKTGIVVLNS